MYRNTSKHLLLLAFVLISTNQLLAQNEVDAVRYSQPSYGLSARAMAMGSAYNAVSNDYSAIFYNPAGLAQMRRMEFNLGFDFYQYQSDANYLDKTTSSNTSSAALNSIGLALPFPTYQGSFTLAFGYNRLSNFAGSQNVNVFSPNSSIADQFLDSYPKFDNQGKRVFNDLASLAWSTYLINDSAGKKYFKPEINAGRVQQNSKLLEDGGKNAFSIAGALEIAPSLFVGVTLNILSGQYNYQRIFTESDVNNFYQPTATLYGFQSLIVTDNIKTEFSGWNVKTGLLYIIDDNFKLGLTVESPSSYSFKDTYNTKLKTSFKSIPAGEITKNFDDELGEATFEYRLKTPFIFGGGLAYEQALFTLSAQATYTDWTQLEYSADGDNFSDINTIFKEDFRQTFDYNFGGEFRPKGFPWRLRGGYSVQQSPYKDINEAKKTWSAGIGFILRKTLTIDVAYLQSTSNMSGILYSGSSSVTEKLKNSSVILTTGFRF